MVKKILVCLDGSQFAEGLLPYAIERAQHFNSKIILLTVTTSMTSVLTASLPGTAGQAASAMVPAQLDDILRKEETAARMYLESVAIRLREMGLDVDYTTRSMGGDSIANTIVVYAAENDVDLIMMATHGHSFWKRLILGSVTESVIRKSTTPVLVTMPHVGKEDNTFNLILETEPV